MKDHLNPSIALYGAPGAGKSTASKFLNREWDYHIASFSGWHVGGLRDVVTRIWGPDAANDRNKLDAIGMAARGADEDAWLTALMRDVDRLEHATHIAVDDMRWPNEWQALAGRGFVFVRVDAHEELRVNRLKATGKFQSIEALRGPIQTALEGYRPDYTIINEEDVAELERQLTDILNRERARRA